MTYITIEQLIEEGKAIRNSIRLIPPRANVISPKVYNIPDVLGYEIWKNKTIRFLSVNFPHDRCITDFENAINSFNKAYNSPIVFDRMLGILESCLAIPTILKSNKNPTNIDKSIKIHLSQNQNQNQSLVINIFIESIKDELTGEQQKELKAIIIEEPDPIKAKAKILDKIKSFGSDVASNIIANIITNSSIWGNF